MVQRTAWDRWRVRCADRESDRNRLAAAAAQCVRGLQRRLLRRWLAYLTHRRRKREEEGEVLHHRHRRLLQAGVTQWLAVGLAIRARRILEAAEADARRAYTHHRALQTLLRRWRYRRAAAGGAATTMTLHEPPPVFPSILNHVPAPCGPRLPTPRAASSPRPLALCDGSSVLPSPPLGTMRRTPTTAADDQWKLTPLPPPLGPAASSHRPLPRRPALMHRDIRDLSLLPSASSSSSSSALL